MCNIDSNEVIEILSTEYRNGTAEESRLSKEIRAAKLEMKNNKDITHNEYQQLFHSCEINEICLKRIKEYNRGISYARELVFELIERSC